MKNQRIIYLWLSLITIALLFLFLAPKPSQENTNTSVIHKQIIGFSSDFTKIAEEKVENVVTVESSRGLSAGFFYRSEGKKSYFLTSYHGVIEKEVFLRFANGYQTLAELKTYDVLADVALLEAEIPYQLEAAEMADTSLLKKGEFALTFGTPISLEYQGSVQLGMISAAARNIRNSILLNGTPYHYYVYVGQLSSSLKEGYSGGPLYNLEGQVIGMNVFEHEGSNASFFVTAEELQWIAEKGIQGDKIHKWDYGFQAEDISRMKNYERLAKGIPLHVEEGIFVQEILPETLASRLDIQKGDIITAINDQKIHSYNDLLKQQYEEITNFEFDIIRQGENLRLQGSGAKE